MGISFAFSVDDSTKFDYPIKCKTAAQNVSERRKKFTMKKITCELCGSNDITKSEDYFICAHCGTKYSTEEAKKLLIEITTPIQIDHSRTVETSRQNARRALQNGNWEAAYKYYGMVEEHEPKNIETIVFSACSVVMLSLADENIYKREQAFNVLNQVISSVEDLWDVEEDYEVLVSLVSAYLLKLFDAEFAHNISKDPKGNVTGSDASVTKKLFWTTNLQFIDTLERICKKHNQVYLNRIIIKHCDFALRAPHKTFFRTLKRDTIDMFCPKITACHKRWNQIDSAHNSPPLSVIVKPYKTIIKEESINAIGCWVGIVVAIILFNIILISVCN